VTKRVTETLTETRIVTKAIVTTLSEGEGVVGEITTIPVSQTASRIFSATVVVPTVIETLVTQTEVVTESSIARTRVLATSSSVQVLTTPVVPGTTAELVTESVVTSSPGIVGGSVRVITLTQIQSQIIVAPSVIETVTTPVDVITSLPVETSVSLTVIPSQTVIQSTISPPVVTPTLTSTFRPGLTTFPLVTVTVTAPGPANKTITEGECTTTIPITTTLNQTQFLTASPVVVNISLPINITTFNP
jgi:hypothetical protein